MSLDEPDNPFHAAALERGEVHEPQIDHHRSLVDYLAVSPDIAPSVYEKQARRLVSVASGVVEALGHLTAPTRGVVLQQQRRNQADDETVLLEELAETEAHADMLRRLLRDMRSVHVDQMVDRDEVAADADDARISQERAAEKAVAEAPRVAS